MSKRTVTAAALAAALFFAGLAPALGHGDGGPGGMMGPGYGMGPGMMGPGYGMGQGTMDPGYGMGPGMMRGWTALPDRDLSADEVRINLEQRLAWYGNPRLKLGKVDETDADTITAEIVTNDGSLVDKLAIDRHSGMMRRVLE